MEYAGNRAARAIGWRPISPRCSRTLIRLRELVSHSRRKWVHRTLGQTTSEEGRRGAKRHRTRPGVVCSGLVGRIQEALRVEQVVLGDVVRQAGPHLRGTPRQVEGTVEGRSRAEDTEEDQVAETLDLASSFWR